MFFFCSFNYFVKNNNFDFSDFFFEKFMDNFIKFSQPFPQFCIKVILNAIVSSNFLLINFFTFQENFVILQPIYYPPHHEVYRVRANIFMTSLTQSFIWFVANRWRNFLDYSQQNIFLINSQSTFLNQFGPNFHQDY